MEEAFGASEETDILNPMDEIIVWTGLCVASGNGCGKPIIVSVTFGKSDMYCPNRTYRR